MANQKKRAFFKISHQDNSGEGGVISSCTLSLLDFSLLDNNLKLQYNQTGTWEKYTNPLTVDFKGVSQISFRAVPDDSTENNSDEITYEEYQIDVTLTYVDTYEIGTFVSVINSTNDYVSPSIRLAYDSDGKTPYFEKCEYLGKSADSKLYANPARYEANRVTRYDYLQKVALPKTVADTRTSILNFYNTNNQRIEQVMIRAKVDDANANADPTRVFPSDGDNNKIMSMLKSSNYALDPDDTLLSNLFVKTGAMSELCGWYYSVNGITNKLSNVVEYSFQWQASLTDTHKNNASPTCTMQSQHYAIYNLYPDVSPKFLSIQFYDLAGNEISDYTSDKVEYLRAATPPPCLSAVMSRNKMMFHCGWIDTTDGLQADLAEVTHDMKCIPYYAESMQDTNGIVETEDLKNFMVELIQMQCDNVDEYYVSHEFYKPEYSRAYGSIIRTINRRSFKNLAHVTSDTLKKNVSDYMRQVDVLLDEYKEKIMTSGLVFLYYLAVLYFIKKTVVYVHGYKQEDIGDYNSCHVMYVPENVPDFESYIREFSLVQDTVDIVMSNMSEDVIYDYSYI